MDFALTESKVTEDESEAQDPKTPAPKKCMQTLFIDIDCTLLYAVAGNVIKRNNKKVDEHLNFETPAPPRTFQAAGAGENVVLPLGAIR